METLRLSTSDEDLRRAGGIIRAGSLVAFPTETVYGLGADALNAEAVASVYEAKGRPSDNPMIVHIADATDLYSLIKGGRSGISDDASKLITNLWPGPLTMVFRKSSRVPDVTTGGLDTVAVRMPSNKTARKLIREAGRPIAAPSANLSGRPSPTTAGHVYADMKGRIPLILDGGACDIGLESTIVDMTVEPPMVLRPGGLPLETLREVVPDLQMDPGLGVAANVTPKAPGMKYRHYAPKAPMAMALGTPSEQEEKIRQALAAAQGRKRGVLTASEHEKDYDAEVVLAIGSLHDPDEMAAHLFDALRRFDDLGCDVIFAETIPQTGIGTAYMNRLRKACGGSTI